MNYKLRMYLFILLIITFTGCSQFHSTVETAIEENLKTDIDIKLLDNRRKLAIFTNNRSDLILSPFQYDDKKGYQYDGNKEVNIQFNNNIKTLGFAWHGYKLKEGYVIWGTVFKKRDYDKILFVIPNNSNNIEIKAKIINKVYLSNETIPESVFLNDKIMAKTKIYLYKNDEIISTLDYTGRKIIE